MGLETGAVIKRKWNVHGPAAFGYTDKRLRDSSLKDENIGTVTANGRGKRDAACGMSESFFMCVMK